MNAQNMIFLPGFFPSSRIFENQFPGHELDRFWKSRPYLDEFARSRPVSCRMNHAPKF